MAVRIAGVTIPSDKRAEISLTYIFGIGKTRSNEILKTAKVNPDTRIKDLTDEEANTLRTIIEKDFRIEGDLKRDVAGNIKRLIEIGCYRGLRHVKKLPVRGQRSKTNSRTVRGGGKRVAVGAKKK